MNEPGNSERLMAAIGQLTGAFRNTWTEPEIQGFVVAVEEIPVGFVEQAGIRLVRGAVDGYDPAYGAPNPPQLAKEARRLWHYELDEINEKRLREEQDNRIEQTYDKAETSVERGKFVETHLQRMDLGNDMRGKPILTTKRSQARQRAEAIEWLNRTREQTKRADAMRERQETVSQEQVEDNNHSLEE